MFRGAFNKAGGKAERGGKKDFLEAVLHERPDLKERPVFFPSQGQKGHVVIIGDEVFKAPRQASGESMDDYDTEFATLKALEGAGITAAIPRITTEGKDYLLFGMTRVPGVTMGSDYDSRLTRDEQRQLAKDLVNFVVEMAHALPEKNGRFAMHDDLYYSNILIDPETKRLAGVIDFGIVKYKTAREWKPMFDFEGTAFHAMLRKEFDRRKSELPGAAEEAPALPKFVRNVLSRISP